MYPPLSDLGQHHELIWSCAGMVAALDAGFNLTLYRPCPSAIFSFESTRVKFALGENQLDHGSWRPRLQMQEKARDAFIVAVVARLIDWHNTDKGRRTGKEQSLSHGIFRLSATVITQDCQRGPRVGL
jgi:hypothetical protein